MPYKHGVVVTGAINLESINGQDIELAGAGIYAATSSAKYSDTKLIGCVGSDIDRNIFQDLTLRFGLDCSEVEILNGKTFTWYVTYSNDKNKILNETKDYGDYYNMIPNPGIIYTEVLLLATGNPFVQKKVLQAALLQKRPKYILFDSKIVHYIERLEPIKSILDETNIFFATQEEIDLFMKKENMSLLSDIFMKFNKLNIIIIKKGASGGKVILRDKKEINYNAVKQKKVVDTTGAGDIFAGTFAGLLACCDDLNSENLIKIIEASATAASRSVAFLGRSKIYC